MFEFKIHSTLMVLMVNHLWVEIIHKSLMSLLVDLDIN
jgi:hypothetical protein